MIWHDILSLISFLRVSVSPCLRVSVSLGLCVSVATFSVSLIRVHSSSFVVSTGIIVFNPEITEIPGNR
jgi:hypothetical protein